MTNEQLYIALGLPVLAVITSLVISLVQISGVRAEIGGIRAEINGIRGEIASLRDDTREIRSDIKLLTGKVYELMERQYAPSGNPGLSPAPELPPTKSPDSAALRYDQFRIPSHRPA